MWIVRLALRQPYTIAVMSFVLMLMGWLAMRSMPVDIFPVIDIPVVAVVWNYNGFSAQDMEKPHRPGQRAAISRRPSTASPGSNPSRFPGSG